ncbi:hypothetical protein [Aliarcobacter cryaerophilus]|uniref:hypothetical protein n=1 Tax=Aliarcobacter cryaerophilus TaxID=28198 RepID=UPI0008271914|nr:hypothetical protein [Aliarcobacter cryaerophilus]
MLVKYFKLILLFTFIIMFSSCSKKEITQKDYIIEDVKVIKSQLNEISNKTNIIQLAYQDFNNYNKELFVELNKSNNENKFTLELNNEFALFKNKIIDIQSQFNIINRMLLKIDNSNDKSDIQMIKHELLLIKEDIIKINENYINQISILKSQNMNLLQTYTNTNEKKNLYLEKEIDNINNQLKTIRDNIITFNNYLKNNKPNEKQIKSEFLIALVGLYGAIIVFLIPHGIDMVSKIGKLYESEIIADLFRKEARVNILHLNLLMAIVINVLLILIYDYVAHHLLLIPVIHFFIIVYFIKEYIKKLNFYTNIDAVLNSIQEDINNEI